MAAVVKDEVFYSLYRDYFKVYLPKQRGSSPHTIKAYKTAVDDLLDFVKAEKQMTFSDVTFDTIDSATLAKFLDDIETKGGTVATRNHRLACVRAFYKYAAKIEPLAVMHRAEILKVPIKKSAVPNVVSYMSEAAVKSILEQPNPGTLKGLRDRFMLLIFYDTGARISEVRGIRVHEVKLGDQPTVLLHGKRSKDRVVPLSEKTAEHFKTYLNVFHQGESQYSQQYLFYTEQHGQKHQIGETAVRDMMTKYCNEARKVCADVPEKIFPHLWRHSRAMHLYQHGMDLTLVSQWLGHADLETTLVYAHADTEHKRKAIAAAVSDDSPLKTFVNPERFTVSDDEELKRLYGLR